MKTLLMKLLRLMTLLKVMSEVVMGVVYMEVDKVADMVVNMEVDIVSGKVVKKYGTRQVTHCALLQIPVLGAFP